MGRKCMREISIVREYTLIYMLGLGRDGTGLRTQVNKLFVISDIAVYSNTCKLPKVIIATRAFSFTSPLLGDAAVCIVTFDPVASVLCT